MTDEKALLIAGLVAAGVFLATRKADASSGSGDTKPIHSFWWKCAKSGKIFGIGGTDMTKEQALATPYPNYWCPGEDILPTTPPQVRGSLFTEKQPGFYQEAARPNNRILRTPL